MAHIDDQLKLVQLLDRELGWIGALEDPIHMRCRTTPGHPTVETVGHEKAVTGHETEPGGRQQTSLDRKNHRSGRHRRSSKSWRAIKCRMPTPRRKVRQILDQFGHEAEDMAAPRRCAPSSGCVFCGATPGFLSNNWTPALKTLRK
jgi:hypothetical protein